MKLRNRLLTALLAGCMLFGVAACGGSTTQEAPAQEEAAAEEAEAEEAEEPEAEAEATEETEEAEAATRTVTDHAGNVVEVPTEINRIVVGDFWPLASQLAVYLGSAEKIVGIDPVSMSAIENGMLSEVYPEILNASTSFIQGDGVNIEELLKLDPDVVLGMSGEAAEACREAGIPTVTFSAQAWDYDILETYHQWNLLLDQVFGGTSEMATRIEAYSEEVYNEIQEVVSTIPQEEKKRMMILFRYTDASMVTSGPKFFGQWWATTSGAINVGEEVVDGFTVPINMEQVYEWDPDLIVITNFTGAQPEDLYTNAIGTDDWSEVSAVVNKEVYKMPLGLYRSYTPGADTPVTLRWYAETVYPDLFDYDLNQIARDYYKDFFGMDLTDEQLEKMYNPSRNGAYGL